MTDRAEPIVDVDRYLKRIGLAEPPSLDRAGLERLQRAHLSTVPFENLHVVAGIPTSTEADWSVPKIVDRGHGGWCFEVNGAFGALLGALGFPAMYLGAAVLLDGPNTMIDHLCLEVTLDQPYLVDVGFGESFIRPLELNNREPQDGGSGTYQLIDGAEGLTLTEHDEDVPVAQYRFRRVALTLDRFQPAADHLAADPDLHWSTKAFATRLLDGGPDRVTLLRDRLKLTRDGATTESPVPVPDWDQTLSRWFDLRRPEPAA